MISQIDLLAVCAGLLASGGAVLGLVAIVGTTRPTRPPSAAGTLLRRWWTGSGRRRGQQRARQASLLTAVGAGALTWLLTGWPVAGVILALAIPGIPWLFLAGDAEKKAIARLGALEGWTRRLAAIVERGIGLQAAIVATAAVAPPLIGREVRELASRLQAGGDAQTVLRQFADEIGDYTGDQVVVPLILQISDRSAGLAAVLTDISGSIAAEIEMRSTINAKRAGPRFAVRFLTGMTVALLAYGLLNPTYLRPYGTPLGQLVLALLAGLYIVLMIWVRNLSLPAKLPRLLASSDTATASEVRA